MKCVVRQECKCHGRLVARETEFCKVAPNVCNGIVVRSPPPSPYIQIAYQFICAEHNFPDNSKVQRSLQNCGSSKFALSHASDT